MSDAIVLEQVTKRFGQKLAVDRLDVRIGTGQITGFIGPNGAGKTTTIRMIMSILYPDSGELSVLGRKSAVESKDRIGYLPEERGVYRKMKVRTFLRHMATLKGMSGNVDRKIDDWLERVELGGVAKKKCEELSKGMQQKIQFISSVIHDPELLILDEPFSGLDPVNMRLLRDLFFEQHERGATIIFSTHVMHQAEELCDHIVMVHNGKKQLDDPLSAIRARYDPRSVLLTPAAGSDADGAGFDHALASAGEVPGVSSVSRFNGAIEAHLTDEADPAAAMRDLLGRVNAAKIELRQPTLEDIFIDIVKGSAVGPDGGGSADNAGEAAGVVDEQALRAAVRGEVGELDGEGA